ncbi:MAG TPA: ABC transporter substrate-binding protein [Alphaproteobacteria bacterium]|nr:ABC transporter substrate-binding protein [Alphaproteobacteria bacterium]
MRFVKSLAAILFAAAGLALAVSAPARAEPVKIRLSYVVPVANWSSLLLAKSDLMTHLGKSYTIESTHFQGTPPMIQALASGDLDIADLAYSSVALAIENAGMTDLRIIGDDFQDGVPGYYSDQYFVLKDGPVKTVADLKGKVLATNAAGSAVDIAMRAMLKRHGLEDKKNVTIIEAAFPNMKAMLIEHKVDLIPGVLPFSTDPGLLKVARPLFTQREAVGRTQMILWAAREPFLKKNHAAMVDFMEDCIRVFHWYLDPKNHDAAVKIAAEVSKRPAASFQGWLFTKKDYYRNPNGLPDLKALQANVETQKKLGFIKTDIDVAKYADLGIAREAAKRLAK